MSNLALSNRFGGGRGLPVFAPGTTAGTDGIAVPNLNDRLNINLPAASPAGSFGLAILGADYLLDLELSAAQNEGRGEVVSSPRVVTANQKEAVIKQGQEVAYVTFQNSGAGGTGTATVQFKEVVLELKVTPTITADDRVVLNLGVKKDAVNRYIDNPGGGQVPIIDKREINTSVLVDNGQTWSFYEWLTYVAITKRYFIVTLIDYKRMLVKKIIVVRHGKSSWSDFSLSDHDRKLDDRGHNDAPFMANLLVEKGHFPQKLISSTAERAKGTAKYFQDVFNIEMLEAADLYHGQPDDYLFRLHQLDESVNCVALFGHNPGITYLANLIDNGCPDNVPTCGIVLATMPIELKWEKALSSKMKLIDIMLPKNYYP